MKGLKSPLIRSIVFDLTGFDLRLKSLIGLNVSSSGTLHGFP